MVQDSIVLCEFAIHDSPRPPGVNHALFTTQPSLENVAAVSSPDTQVNSIGLQNSIATTNTVPSFILAYTHYRKTHLLIHTHLNNHPNSPRSSQYIYHHLQHYSITLNFTRVYYITFPPPPRVSSIPTKLWKLDSGRENSLGDIFRSIN